MQSVIERVKKYFCLVNTIQFKRDYGQVVCLEGNCQKGKGKHTIYNTHTCKRSKLIRDLILVTDELWRTISAEVASNATCHLHFIKNIYSFCFPKIVQRKCGGNESKLWPLKSFQLTQYNSGRVAFPPIDLDISPRSYPNIPPTPKNPYPPSVRHLWKGFGPTDLASCSVLPFMLVPGFSHSPTAPLAPGIAGAPKETSHLLGSNLGPLVHGGPQSKGERRRRPTKKNEEITHEGAFVVLGVSGAAKTPRNNF